MRTKLASFAAGAVMLSASGIACAETTVPTLEPFGAPAIVQTKTVTPMALTDDQMEKVTAGHYIGRWHYGYFYLRSYYGNYWWVYGRHFYRIHY